MVAEQVGQLTPGEELIRKLASAIGPPTGGIPGYSEGRNHAKVVVGRHAAHTRPTYIPWVAFEALCSIVLASRLPSMGFMPQACDSLEQRSEQSNPCDPGLSLHNNKINEDLLHLQGIPTKAQREITIARPGYNLDGPGHSQRHACLVLRPCKPGPVH